MKPSSVVLAAQGGNSTGSVLDRITTQNPTLGEFRQPFDQDALAAEFADDDVRREKHLHLLVGLIVALGAQGVMRYDKRRNVATARFSLKPPAIRESHPARNISAERWCSASRMGRLQVEKWAYQIVAQRAGATTASVELNIVLGQALIGALLTDLLLQQVCGLGFGDDANQFLDRLQDRLASAQGQGDAKVRVNASLKLGRWRWDSPWSRFGPWDKEAQREQRAQFCKLTADQGLIEPPRQL